MAKAFRPRGSRREKERQRAERRWLARFFRISGELVVGQLDKLKAEGRLRFDRPYAEQFPREYQDGPKFVKVYG